MISKIFKILLILITTLPLLSCEEEFSYYVDETAIDGLPIIISSVEMDELSTRSVEGPKKSFIDGDVIHISGQFKDKNGKTTNRYGAMKLVNNKWIPVDESSALKWPIEAVSGDFTAYYICDGNGDLLSGSISNNSLLSVDLSDIKNDKDPLKAVETNVVYGHTLNLKFKHICTHLTFKELEYGITKEYWLVKNTRNDGKNLNNAFSFGLSADNLLEFNFIAVPDEDFNGLVYINRPFTSDESSDRVNVGYFLEPGDYSDIELRLINSHPYLSWQSDKTSNLLGNKTYTVNIEQSLGVTIIEDTEVEWDEDIPVKVDPETFLKAIEDHADYTLEDGTPILRAVENGMVLLHCVSFNNEDEEYYDGFFADNPAIFDGNFHYISDLAFPLFRYNRGTIQNLGLKDLKTTITSIDGGADYDIDKSRQGGLCRWNQGGAIIHNVRLENIELTVNIKNKTTEETHNAGCLTGVNSGNISSVQTKGVYNIKVQNAPESDGTICTVIVGGLIGQNVGVVKDISPMEDSENNIVVLNDCKGNGPTYYMGGGIGLSSGLLEHVIIPNVNVYSSSDNEGAIGYVGGLVGDLHADITHASSVTSCMVGGSISPCNIKPYGIIKPFLYIGGIAGGVMNFSVLNCRSVCDVNGSNRPLDDITNGCGGAFGRIISSEKIADLTIYGQSLTGYGNIGCFAGIAPQNSSWEEVYDKDNNYVRKFEDKPYIKLYENLDGN